MAVKINSLNVQRATEMRLITITPLSSRGWTLSFFFREDTQKFCDKAHQWAVIASLTAATQMYDDDRIEATFI